RHLVVLARRLNYVRAAEELGITQPTLTRSIQALEKQLQVRLFDRDRGGVALTPQGRQIAERAGFLLIEAGDLEAHSQLYGKGGGGRIRFGMAPMPARIALRQALAKRLKQAPNVTNDVIIRDVEALWAMLIAGEIEFFVSPDRPPHDLSQIHVELLGTFPLSFIVRAGHPLLQGEKAGSASFPLIRSSWTGRYIPSEIQGRIIGNPNVIEDFGTLAGLAADTDAIWLSSICAVQDEIAAGSLVELMRAPQQVGVNIYSLKRRTRTPLASAIIAALGERVQDLLSLTAEMDGQGR
ncbi:MAG: LysR family transcriptional regulator, partial [Rhizobium sp.]|nr:LysR family transcriptional regulator [Rhizobium sp.]